MRGEGREEERKENGGEVGSPGVELDVGGVVEVLEGGAGAGVGQLRAVPHVPHHRRPLVLHAPGRVGLFGFRLGMHGAAKDALPSSLQVIATQ